MRIYLFAAASLAPLLLAVTPAAATVVIGAVSPPVATATAGGGAPDDVVVNGAGAINLTAAGAALTRNSNNAITNSGSLSATDIDNAIGVQLNAGTAGRFENTGVINIGESYTATDSANSDAVAEAPFAKGVGRYGVRLSGAGVSGGDIVQDGGSITVKGNSSYGISLESPVSGQFVVTSSVSLTGDVGAAVRSTSTIAGPVTLSGPISATGQGSVGASFTGDLGNRLSVYGGLTSTGYATTVRTTGTALANIQKTPTDVEQGGSALVIGGNVAGGVFFGAPPGATAVGSTDDLDGDGVQDGVEGVGSATTYGSAPAVLIGATGRTVTLGNFDNAANAFGLIIRGAISGQGVYDGVTATGLQLGTGDGSTTNLSGGLRVVGAIGAISYSADATAIHLTPGVIGGAIINEGTISSSILASTTAVNSRAILLDAGASVATIANAGIISATAVGDSANAAAIVDRSGRVTFIGNSNTISAVLAPTLAVDAVTGSTTAIDASANTTGLTLRQEFNSSGTTPSIVGDVLLGSGPNTVQLLGGTIVGALQLGGAPSSITIDNGASYTGALRYSGQGLAVNIVNGVLSDTATGKINLASLNIGAAGNLKFAVDPVAGASTTFAVVGPATLATGAKLGLNVLSIPSAQLQTFTLLTSPQLSLGAVDTSQIAALPFLFSGTLRSTGTSLVVDLQRRSAVDLGLDAAAGTSLDVVSAGVNRQASVQAALLGQTTAAGFSSLYNQLLPDRSDGVFRLAEQASRAVGDATGAFPDSPAKLTGGAWVQQLVVGYQKDQDATEKVEAGGYGFAVGAQTAEGYLGSFGLTGAFVTGTTTDNGRPADTNVNLTELEGGAYWQATIGGLRLDARAAGGYLFLTGVRGVQAAATATSSLLEATSKSDRNGYTISGRAGAAYQLDFGRFFLRPQAHYDYFRLNEDGYTETGGGTGLDLSVASREGDQSSATGSVVLGAKFGTGFLVRPSLELGVRDVFSGDAGDVVAGYAAGGATYRLTATPLTGTLPLARLALKGSAENFEIGIEAGAEAKDKYKEGDVKGTIKILF